MASLSLYVELCALKLSARYERMCTFVSAKVIIHKSGSEVSLVEQDIFDYVSKAYFEPKKR